MKSVTTKASEKFCEKKHTTKKITDYEAKIRQALVLQSEIAEKKQMLDELKEFFLEILKSDKSKNSLVTTSGTVICQLTNSYKVDPVFVPQLKDIFNGGFPGMVSEKKEYSPTAAMRKLLADADYEHIDLIRDSVRITSRHTITFEPLSA